MTVRSRTISLWRGALGGLVGDVCKAAIVWLVFNVLYPKRIGYLDNASYILGFAVLGIPSTALIGLMIAALLRLVSVKICKNLGILTRGIIGAGLLFTLCETGLLLASAFPKMNRWFGDNLASWMIAAPFYVDFGVIVGAVAGMMAGRRKTNSPYWRQRRLQ